MKRKFLEFAFVLDFDMVCNAVLTMGKPLEVLLMPGLAFDGQGHRLGRGGGYASVYVLTGISRTSNPRPGVIFFVQLQCLRLRLCLVCLSVSCLSVFWLSVCQSVCLSVSGSLFLSMRFCLSLRVCVHTLVVCWYIFGSAIQVAQHAGCQVLNAQFLLHPDAVSMFW